jgi:hypothetical protein
MLLVYNEACYATVYMLLRSNIKGLEYHILFFASFFVKYCIHFGYYELRCQRLT